MTTKNKKIFSIYIESLMLKNGCGDDVVKFANLLGINKRTMYEWLRAKYFPSNRSLVKLKNLEQTLTIFFN